MTDIAELALKIDATQVKSAGDALDSLARSSSNTEREVSRATSGISRGFEIAKTSVAGLVAGIASVQTLSSSTRSFLEFDKSLKALSTQLGDATNRVTEFEAASKSLAAQFGTDALQQSKAFYEILSAGITETAKATDLLTEANKLAIGGQADLQATISGLTSIIKGYGDKVTDVKDISNAFFTSSLAGKISIEELASGLGRVVPLAEVLGVSFDELSASVAALTLGGTSASESITGVRAILAAVAKPSSEAAKLANQLGLEFNSAAIQSKGFAGFLEDLKQKTGGSADALAILFGGIEATIPAMALAGNAGKEFNSIMLQMADKAGVAEDAFNKMASAPGFKIDRFMSAINRAAITLGDTLAGFLAPAAEAAANALNSMMGANQVSGIEKQKQKVLELVEAVDSINESRRTSLAGKFHTLLPFTTTDKELHELESTRDREVEILSKMIAEEAALAETLETKTNPAVKSASELNLKLEEATKKQLSEAERFLISLRDEVGQLGLTSSEIKKMEAAKLGVLAAASPLIDKIEQENEALRKAEQFASNYSSQLAKAAQVTDAARTKEEIFIDKHKELTELLSLPIGGISLETYNRSLRKASEEYANLGAEGKKALDEISQFAIQAERNMQNALGQALFDGIQGRFDSMVDGFKNAITQMLAQAFAADIWGALFNKKTGNLAALGGAFGLSGNASAGGMSTFDMASFGMNALSLGSSAISTGFGATKVLGGMGGALPGEIGAFFSGMGGGTIPGVSSSAALAGSSFAAVAGPLAAAAALTQVFKMFAGDKRMGGGFGNALNFMGDIPILGDLMPVVPLMNSLFGHGPFKQKETFIEGDIGSKGFESGFMQTGFKAKGGAFVKDNRGFARVDATTDLPFTDDENLGDFANNLAKAAKPVFDLINDSVTNVSTSLRQMGKDLGLSTESIDNFNTHISLVSESGQFLNQEQIGTEIQRISNELIHSFIPSIDSLSKSGESAFQTVQRLGVEFNVLTGLGVALGNSLDDTKSFLQDMSLEDRTAFVNQAGGSDVLAQNIATYSQNFLTPEEQLAPIKEHVTSTLKELSLEGIKTKEQFKEVVESFGQVNGISKETEITLLGIAGDFAKVADAGEQLKKSLPTKAEANQNLLSLAERFAPEEVTGIKFNMMSGALSQFGVSADISKEGLIELMRGFVNSGGLMKDIAGDVLKAFGIAMDYFDTVDQKATNILNNLRSNFDSAFGNLEGALQTERDRLTTNFNTQLETYNTAIQNVTETISKLQTVSDALKGTARQILPMGVDEARSILSKSIEQAKQGIFPELAAIQPALQALANQSTSGFSTREAFEDSKAANVKLINQLGGLTDSKLSAEQLSLRTLEDSRKLLEDGFKQEIEKLDSIEKSAKEQKDLLGGFKSSIDLLTTTLGEFNRLLIQSGASAIRDPRTGQTPIDGNPGISNADIQAYFSVERTPEEIFRDATKNNVSSSQIRDALGLNQADVDKFFRDNKGRIPRFATGASSVPNTGLAIVEQGERILNPQQNEDLIKVLKELLTETKKVAVSNAESAKRNKEVADSLMRMSLGGTSMRTTAA